MRKELKTKTIYNFGDLNNTKIKKKLSFLRYNEFEAASGLISLGFSHMVRPLLVYIALTLF